MLNLQTDQKFIDEALAKIAKKTLDNSERSVKQPTSSPTTSSSSLSNFNSDTESKDLEQGAIKTTLAETPSITKMTEHTISCMNKEDSPVIDKNKLFEKNIGK